MKLSIFERYSNRESYTVRRS